MELNIDLSNIPYSSMAINKNSVNNISTSITFNSYFEAPLVENSNIGFITLKVDDMEYFSMDIFNDNEIRKKDFFDYWVYFLHNLGTDIKF